MAHAYTHSPRRSSHYDVDADVVVDGADSFPPVLSSLLAWLPALFILVGLPVLALFTTKYVVLPSVRQAYAQEAAAAADIAAPILAQIPVSVAPVPGNHHGFRSIALVAANNDDFQKLVSQNKSRLTAVAAKDLSGKSVTDLDKPGVLEATRAQ
jgi:hypothetical protein